jgi:hypothetical protein
MSPFCFSQFSHISISKKAESLEDSVKDIVSGISSVVLSEGQSDSDDDNDGDQFDDNSTSGGAEDRSSSALVELDPVTLAAVYKQAYTKFNIKQKDCIKFLVEKV